jgi:glutathione S-transferase
MYASEGQALRLYGHKISQPTRAVLWALAMKKVPFEFVALKPMSGDTLRDAYLSKFPTGTAPAIEHDVVRPNGGGVDVLCITEGAAILSYLADFYKWDDLYPSDLQQRARVNQWLHWHHENLRPATDYMFRPLLRVEMGAAHRMGALDPAELPVLLNKGRSILHDSMLALRFGAFNRSGGPFFLGAAPSIADILAYSEIDQLYAGAVWSAKEAGFDDAERWVEAMRTLPEHDAVRDEMNALMERLRKHRPTSQQ